MAANFSLAFAPPTMSPNVPFCVISLGFCTYASAVHTP